MKIGQKWSPVEDEVIRRSYESVPTKKIAVALGRSVAGVRNRASMLGVRRERPWTEDDDCALTQMSGIVPDDVIAAFLKRTNGAVVARRRHLKALGTAIRPGLRRGSHG